mmetsp:Transcript_15816/g.43751  ORF Transcript_15816/g.43751 Transcript_15816/m.43751 type:complete len:583 (-) Transcript_15816:248-1996(-)
MPHSISFRLPVALLLLLCQALHPLGSTASQQTCTSEGSCPSPSVDCNDGRYWCLTDPEAFLDACESESVTIESVCPDIGGVVFVPKPQKKSHCQNRAGDEDCEALIYEHDCLLNPNYMLEHCAKACMVCFDHHDTDDSKFTEVPIGVSQLLPESLSDSDARVDVDSVQRYFAVLTKTADYMSNTVFAQDGGDSSIVSARASCRNYDQLCAWNVATNENYCDDADSQRLCGPACGACHELVLDSDDIDIVRECLPDLSTNAFSNQLEDYEEEDYLRRLKNGDVADAERDDHLQAQRSSTTIDAMFRRIIGELPYPDGDERPLYASTVLSRPALDPSIHNKSIPLSSLKSYVGGPWIVVLDDFLTDEECDRLIQLGDKIGRDESSIEEEDEEGEEPWRTSTTAWCSDDFCLNDPIVQTIQRKIGLTTGVLDDNYYEHLQLLKYVPGQFYKEHHDEKGDVHGERFDPAGPRVLTFFLYLNDVEAGGETRFTDLFGDGTSVYLDVQPKKGSALLWPSMRIEDLLAMDTRTYHAALSVTKGLKYAANAWMHLRAYRDHDCEDEEIKSILDRLPPLPLRHDDDEYPKD